MSEVFGNTGNRSAALKAVLKSLHDGADPEELKEAFAEVVRDTTPAEVAKVEQELIEEGMPREEIQQLCDVHLALFRESLEREQALAPAGHPVRILMEEHAILLRFAHELRELANELRGSEDLSVQQMERLDQIAQHFRHSESHYLREENVLFPYLEKHGITQPPAIMWMEHDKIRSIEKDLHGLVDAYQEMDPADYLNQLPQVATSLADMLSSHFQKENSVLFPTALKVIGDSEWEAIRDQFDELGYTPFTPPVPKLHRLETRLDTQNFEREGVMHFATGTLSKEQTEAVLNALPVDITFVDHDDRVRYFNESSQRIFPRTRAVIGRKVQECHPEKSVHVVSQILEDFRSGSSDVAEFWIDLKGRLVHIRYYPVRNATEDYVGCLEVTQDITDIRQIEGEKRLLSG
ncbi:MAG: histidine kinase [Chloroflexi bacterium B3_Chlor]|nr:MAG: histidine kinase [Chloroflexi bacterium B3_Chlor]